MNTEIENFFAQQTSQRLSNEENDVFKGVVAYVYGFHYVPGSFFRGNYSAIVDSARVDAAVTAEEMEAWLEANADKINAAIKAFRL